MLMLFDEIGKGRAGYEALVTRLREARQTCEELKTMFHEMLVYANISILLRRWPI